VTSNGINELRQSPDDFLSGGGELGALMRAFDWSATALGPAGHWPQSLRTSVSICLASRFPIVLYWGPDYTVLYNDAYSAILGSKHPWALGKKCSECWAEIWETIGPMLDGVVATGEATWSNDLLLQLERFGYPEECYFSFSFSPVRVEAGVIGGVFTAVIETTDRFIGGRRLDALRELAVRITDADSESKMSELAMEALERNPYDTSFGVLYLLGESGRYIEPKGWCGIKPDHDLCKGPQDLQRPESPVFEAVASAFRTGEISVASDLGRHCPSVPSSVWGIPPIEAAALPIILPGYTAPHACLLVGLNPRKRFNPDYRAFLEMTARQFASNLAAARIHEEERKRAETLAELDRAKTVFFSNVSHEFRTPLTLILGPIESMIERARPSSFVSKDELELVHRNSMRLLKLTNTLLDFSGIEAGGVQAVYEPTDLSALTKDTASAFRSAMEEAGLEFVIDCPPLSESVYVDREMWEKIVLNLISNAFKFTLAGRVEVRIRELSDQIELRVKDTGLGISKEDRPKVFERFHRVEGLHGRTHEGSGIGLALVQELVRLQGGSIRVESALGKGSSFIVSIRKGRAHVPPERLGSERLLKSTGASARAYVNEALGWLPQTVEVAERPKAFASDSVQAPHMHTATGRILLADDNADMRQYVRRLLGDYYEIHEVSNGREALAAINGFVPDLVLTDVMMPELDGFGLLRELRRNESTRTIPVILLSARAGEDARIEGMEIGADDYIVKPFTARELLARVSAHITLGRVRREAVDRERALRAELEIRVRERTGELQSANRELRELSSRLQQSRDDERRRIARDLHDSAGQLLAAIAMNVAAIKRQVSEVSEDVAKRIDEAASMIDQLSTEIRTISHLLHPPLLDEVGLTSALRWYVAGFAERSKISATLDLPESLGRLPADVEIAVFRAVQECLTNIHRHAHSPSCAVKVSQESNRLRIEIRDAGTGIAKDRQTVLEPSGSGVGLRGLRERLGHLGGALEISSSPNGTVVVVTVPIRRGVDFQVAGAN
jgi:signal transduction histidine kinase